MAVYFMQPVDGGPIKIGYSADVERRRSNLEAHYSRKLAILGTMPGDREAEIEIHERFAHLRIGRTEQFRPARDLLEFIGRPLLVSPNPEAVEAMEGFGKRLIMQMRGSAEFKEWLEKVAAHDRNSVAEMAERAIIRYAKFIEFPDPPPIR